MKHQIVTICLICAGLCTCAVAERADKLSPEQIAARNQRLKQKMSGKSFEELLYMRTGGRITQPNSGRGKVAIFNAQSRYSDAKLKRLAERISLFYHVNVEVIGNKSGDLSVIGKLKDDAAAAVAISVVDSESLPKSLVNYEDSWGIVNLHSVNCDPKDPKHDSRCEKLIYRTFLLTAGLADATAIGSVMWPVRKTEDLDSIGLPERPYPNLMSSVLGHLDRLGIKLTTVKTYREACQEGWAPAPTNDVQKAIWDKVHQLPTEPLKIKPETKKVVE